MASILDLWWGLSIEFLTWQRRVTRHGMAPTTMRNATRAIISSSRRVGPVKVVLVTDTSRGRKVIRRPSGACYRSDGENVVVEDFCNTVARVSCVGEINQRSGLRIPTLT